MARTMKYLERKARETYAEYLEFGELDDCPFGYEKGFVPWAKDLFDRLNSAGDKICIVCKHFLKYEITCEYGDCPCYNMGANEPLAMLKRHVKKWREEGLI